MVIRHMTRRTARRSSLLPPPPRAILAGSARLPFAARRFRLPEDADAADIFGQVRARAATDASAMRANAAGDTAPLSFRLRRAIYDVVLSFRA